MKSSHFLQKFLFFIAAYVFFRYSRPLGVFIFVITSLSIFLPHLLIKADKTLEFIVRYIGKLLLQLLVVFTYLITIMPFAFIRKKEMINNTNYKDVSSKKINFDRLF